MNANYERERAIMEGERNASADRYFDARPQLDTLENGSIYDAGFTDAYRTQAAKIEALIQELADAKQAARYETDVARQAIADFEEAKDKIEALERASQWQPIDSAPCNESIDVLIKSKDSSTYSRRVTDICRVGDKWLGQKLPVEKFGEYISHWMPVPKPPIAGEAT